MLKSKKFWFAIGTLILTIGVIGIIFLFKLYHAFSFGPVLFKIKHNNFSHLNIYTNSWSFYPGDEVEIFGSVSSPDTAKIQLSEYQSFSKKLVEEKAYMPFQKVEKKSSIEGAGWKSFASLQLPNNLSSGWYVLEVLVKGESTRTSIFIHPDTSQIQNEFAYVFPVNTWNAYNYWGGSSLYNKARSSVVSFQRPFEAADPFLEYSISNYPIAFQSIGKEKFAYDFLRESDYGVDPYTEVDMTLDGEWMHHYKGIVIGGHSEYWTEEMWDHLQTYLDSGGTFICLSGNTAFWSTKLLGDGKSIEVIKEDPHTWKEKDSEKIGMLGVHTNLNSMHTYSPYKVAEESSWVFHNTKLENGDDFGAFSEIHDYTVFYDGFWGKLKFLFAEPGHGAACGLEVDRLYDQSPKNWVTVAKGYNPIGFGHGEVYPDEKIIWTEEGGGVMGYYDHPGGGFVFNVGSMSFPGAIPHDENIQQILLNVLNRAARSVLGTNIE